MHLLLQNVQNIDFQRESFTLFLKRDYYCNSEVLLVKDVQNIFFSNGDSHWFLNAATTVAGVSQEYTFMHIEGALLKRVATVEAELIPPPHAVLLIAS